MAPIRGWGVKGERLKGFAPDGRWRTLTFLAALRADALTAPCVVDGPINGGIFRAYVEQFLLPQLRPGDIVVLDNLGSHRAQTIRHAIIAAGAKLAFLPPYSPDLNPIEMAWSKLKSAIRSLKPRRIDDLVDATRRALEAITGRDRLGWLRHAGYGQNQSVWELL